MARRTTELGYKRIGRIEKLAADHGDPIHAGQLLAVLDTGLLETEKAVLLAQRDAAVARLDEYMAGPRKQSIAAARAQLSQLQAVRDRIEATFSRRSRLAGSDAIATQDIDDSRHQLAAAEAQIEVQQHTIAELEEGTRKEQIAAQRAEVARLDASVQNLAVQIEESHMLAPYDAIVSRRFVDEGAIVQPGVPLFKIIELAPLEAWVGLPPETCTALRIGQDYPLNLHGLPIQGRLKATLPELDPATRTQTAIFDLEPRDESLSDPVQPVGTVGEIVNLDLVQTMKQSGFWLPVSALTRGVKGLWSVYVVIPDENAQDQLVVKRSDIEIVQIDSNRVLVNGTVRDGDRVVVSGVQRLTPGQRVQLADITSSSPATPDPK